MLILIPETKKRAFALQDPFYYDVIQTMKDTSSCSVLISTSMNVRGEPIAKTYRCLTRTPLDALIIGPFLLYKSERPDRDLKSANNESGLD